MLSLGLRLKMCPVIAFDSRRLRRFVFAAFQVFAIVVCTGQLTWNAAGESSSPGDLFGSGATLSFAFDAGGQLTLTEKTVLKYTLGITAQSIVVSGGSLHLGDGTLGFSNFEFIPVPGFAPGNYVLIECNSPIEGHLGGETSGVVGAYQAAITVDGDKLVLQVDGPARPVAIFGSGFGVHDVTRITRTIFDYEDWVFEDRGTFMPAGDFSDYALVIICYRPERPYTAEEHALISQYVSGGGKVLLINQAPVHIFDPSDAAAAAACAEWMGFISARNGSLLDADPATVPVIDDPLLAGVATASGPRPSWVTGDRIVRNLAEGAKVLIGTPDNALAVRRPFGLGEVLYLGPELFRLRQSEEHAADSGLYVTLIRNIIQAATPLTVTAWHAMESAAWEQAGQRFLLWNREWQRGTEAGPVFLPPLPQEEELIAALRVDLALNEYEAMQINLSDLGQGGILTWDIELNGLPQDALELFVQDRPNPIPWPANPGIAQESPFWLMPPYALDPLEEDAVFIDSGQTRILWLKWNSHGLNPGTHTAWLHCFVDGHQAVSLELDVHIHPFRIPRRRPISLRPAGHVYGDVNNAAPAMRFKRNLRDHGFEWSFINVFRLATFSVNESPLNASWLAANIDAVSSESPPLIDFSSLDPFIDAALEHNLTYFTTVAGITTTIDNASASAGLDQQQVRQVRHWFVGNFVRYMNDKGIRDLQASRGDELSDAALRDEFLPWSLDLAEAGMKTTSSFTTASVADPELTAQLAPVVGAWTLNRQFLSTLRGWIRDGSLELPAGTLVGTYGAGEGRGTEIRKNASASRMIGWEAWDQGSNYCAPNPYFKSWLYYTEYSLDRGLAGERFVSYLDIDDLDAPLVNSPFIEGIRESMEEANLAWLMSWYMQSLGDKVPADLRARASALVGRGVDNVIRYRSGSNVIGEENFTIEASREEYVYAKREVLSILTELQPLVDQYILPDAWWHRHPLVIDAVPVASLIGSADAVHPIQDALTALVGESLPLRSAPAAGDMTVVYVGAMDDPELPNAVLSRAHDYLPDSNWIRDWTENGMIHIWIGGTDAAQLAKAVERFPFFFQKFVPDSLIHRFALKPTFLGIGEASGILEEDFFYQIEAIGDPPPSHYSISELPSGLVLDAHTGVIHGIPLETGIFNLAVTAVNEGGSRTTGLQLKLAIPSLADSSIYRTWAIANGLDPDDTGAPDVVRHHGGWNNAAKYAFGVAPVNASAPPQAVTRIEGNTLTVEYTGRQQGVAYTLKTSPQLNGPFAPMHIESELTPDQSGLLPGYNRYHFQVPLPATGFFRVEAIFTE